MQSENISLNKKIKELTVKEFFGLLNDWSSQQRETAKEESEEWEKGVVTLSKHLKCSSTTAYRYVHDEMFADAVRKVGGTYYFNWKKVSDILSRKKKRHATR